jgi:hypothetical protein
MAKGSKKKKKKTKKKEEEEKTKKTAARKRLERAVEAVGESSKSFGARIRGVIERPLGNGESEKGAKNRREKSLGNE